MNDYYGDLKTFISPTNHIATQLRDEIRRGSRPLGGALPTERVLSERYKVSRWTIREALKVLEREHLIVRQQGRGTFVVSSLDAKPAVGLGTGLLGLMVSEVEYGFSGLVQGTCTAAAERGYAVTTGSIHTLSEETPAVRAFTHNDTLGVVLARRSLTARRYYEELLSNDIAVVLVDMLIPGCEEDNVLIDNSYGTVLATSHLLQLGHRRVAYVAPKRDEDLDMPISTERRAGFKTCCRRNAALGLSTGVLEFQEERYQAEITDLLTRSPRPTGIVAYNDLWAIRVMQVARQVGLDIPGDLSVVGFDDSILAATYDLPLTTVNPERYDMGVTAVELLVAKIEQKKPRPCRSIRITPRLVKRESTAIVGKN